MINYVTQDPLPQAYGQVLESVRQGETVEIRLMTFPHLAFTAIAHRDLAINEVVCIRDRSA